MKKILSVLLALIMIFTVIGTMSIAKAETTFKIIENKDYIRPVGRYEWVDNGLACDWVASGFEFTADCEGDISVTMTASCSDVGSKGDWNKDGYLTVFIDGVRQSYRVRYMSGTLTVNIAEDLPAGVHTFRVFDQGDLGTKTVFHSVNLSGTLGEKPAEKEVIEFIGDSITVGYGSLDNPSGPAARYSDATRTYAFITAENFGMEARVVARSGGTMNSEYTDYTTNQRAGGSYDYSLKKPKAVVIALGANDGAKTIDYYKTNIKKFVDAIRTGYNDVNIPFVFTSYIMSTGEALRYNQTQAIKLLQEQDPVAYGNLHYAFCDTNAGGHPNQAQHLKAGNRLTRELIELGVMSETDLRDDATITLTKNATAQSSVNKFDSVVGVGKPAGSSVAYSGITGELVDPLDPADAGSETAKAVKYTVDGTQESTSDYRYLKVTAGTINNAIMNTKGISFYINYKDTNYTGA
ncbi:MAG: hypothetical protein IIU65_04990, partial [Clostridia bacterium]|nr:hypothetical protein [Clostridia bacterium]